MSNSTVNSADKVSMQNPTRGGQTTSIENSVDLENTPSRLKRLLGILTMDNQTAMETAPSKDRSRFNCSRYKFFLDDGAPHISSKCCDVMKKGPAHEYKRKTNRFPMTAQMASESRLRTQQWLRNGCNGFDMTRPISNPMAFWTEQDVLLYVSEHEDELIAWRRKEIEKKYGCKPEELIDDKTGGQIYPSGSIRPLASVYGEVVKDYQAMGQSEGQMSFSDYGIFDLERPILKTTGCNRTGCVFCGYGCHLEKYPGRFEMLKGTHPKLYKYIMKPWNDGGLNYKEVIDWINKHGNLNIRY